MLLTGKIDTSAIVNAVEDVVKPSVIKDYLNELPSKALNVGIRVVLAALVFFIGIWIIKLIRKIVNKSMKKASADAGVAGFIDSFLKAALYILLIFLIASYLGVDAASIIAIVGSAGVAIGLALQGSLSNLAGGVLILLLKPFKIGDYIVDNSTGKEGTVKEIQIFYTKLITFDNQMVVLPNGNLANSAITNVTKESTRRIDIPVGISYNSDIKAAKDALIELLNNDAEVLQDNEKSIAVTNLGASSVDLNVRFWVKTSDYWNAKFRITENIKTALDMAGVRIPYQQIDVHLDK